jgi:predicted DNA-binding protein (UPF0251 family)
MEGEKIYMSQRQLQRLEVMSLVEAGKITLQEGAEKIGMSYRQTKRIRKRVQEKGGKGLLHGNTGNPSNHRMKEGIRAKVLQLSRKVYGEFNDQHFTEKLAEEEGIEISRETASGGDRAEAEEQEAPEAAGTQSPGGLDGPLGWKPASLVRARSSSLLFDGGPR